jgi:hypothetical protein
MANNIFTRFWKRLSTPITTLIPGDASAVGHKVVSPGQRMTNLRRKVFQKNYIATTLVSFEGKDLVEIKVKVKHYDKQQAALLAKDEVMKKLQFNIGISLDKNS